MGIQKLEHVGVVVKSIDESAAFYGKVLGMELKEIRQPNAKTRLGFLGFPGEAALLIELVERADSGLPGEGTVNHIAFTVNDIDEEASRIAELGVTFLHEKVITVGDGTRFIFFKGPDGEHLELYQPAVKIHH
ncbi:VOC family protein [Paenibacillus sp. OAE614]|uniref:VOC family protein n=1 Tax=Paenibacillus sp. OAE614 TaxID=2663804 RepID=UPI0017894767